MEWYIALGLMLGLLLVLMMSGLPVAIAFLGVNVAGALLFLGGEIGLEQLTRNMFNALSSFTLAPIPLFLLMGEILFHTGMAFKAIEAVDRLIARVPGRLSLVSVLGGTLFSSLSGSTVANTAILGSVLLPDMLKRGYHPGIAMGPIMATGGIAMLIPPSALAVLLGSLAGMSITQLLIAGILPGILMSLLFVGYVVIRCHLQPELAPAYDVTDYTGWERWRPFVVHVLPLMMIFVVVVGSIVMGWATPTESAALGSVASLLLGALCGGLTRSAWHKILTETAKISVMILFIIAGSITFSQVLAFSGATDGLLQVVRDIDPSPLMLLGLMVLVLLFLGMFMDQVSMAMITIPFFLPMAEFAGIDLIWLGVLMLVIMEVSFTTPPFGLLLFVMKGVAPPGITLRQVYAAAMPFIMLEAAVLALLFLFPELALFLPGLIRN